ncbi:MAG: hypothetical protein KDD62_12195 [Bdellovibrionales bacterium]|nr:hypothetical protein [Bdellovibrionales bacterium]
MSIQIKGALPNTHPKTSQENEQLNRSRGKQVPLTNDSVVTNTRPQIENAEQALELSKNIATNQKLQDAHGNFDESIVKSLLSDD